jgi:hypothetical protein
MEDVKGNLKDYKILKLLDKFKGLFGRLGINYPLMRKLLELMLIMDRRRSTVIGGQSNKKNADVNPFKGYLIAYGIIGLFTMAIIFIPSPLFYKMSIIYGMVIFMVMTTMISDFSTVLLDVKDKSILVPMPIDSKTINAAKTIHIFIYISTVMAIMAGPSLIAGLFKYGPLFFIMFLTQLLFVTIFIIFLTSIFYFLILHFFDGEKLKDIINYFQIILAVVMTIGYQLIGRMFNVLPTHAAFIPKWWSYLIPPVWFAAPYSVIFEGTSGQDYVILSILSILVPVMLFWLYSRKMSPYFERKLQKLSSVDKQKAGFIEKRQYFKRKLTGILCRDRLENIFCRFTGNMVSNERQLKLKLYPKIAYSAIFPFIFLFSMFTGSRSFADFHQDIVKMPYYLGAYLTAVLLSSSPMLLYGSEKYKGSWIYKVLPIEDPSPIYKGFIKSFIIKFVLPVFVFTGGIFTLLYGPFMILQLIPIFINFIILTLVVFTVTGKSLPFGREIVAQQQSEGCLVVILEFVYCGLSALLQYFLAKTGFGIAIYIVLLAAALAIVWKRSFRISWDKIS